MTVNEHFFAWLDELESGRREQGRDVLHRIIKDDEGNVTEQMCCLGVCSALFAADLGLKVEDKGWGSIYYNDMYQYPELAVFEHMGIPKSHLHARSLGYSVLVEKPDDLGVRVSDDSAWYFSEETQVPVDTLNDNGYSFEEIAHLLRKEFAPETINTKEN